MFERVEHGETIGILNTDGNVVVMTPLEEPIQNLLKMKIKNKDEYNNLLKKIQDGEVLEKKKKKS